MKKRMKKSNLNVCTLILALILLLTCAGCGSSNSDTSSKASGETKTDAASKSSGDDQIVINIGHGGSEATAQQVGCLALKEYLETNSDGRFAVNIYPNNSMGSDDELCQMVQSGTLEMCLANSIIVNYVPDATIYDMYFRFNTLDEVLKKFQEDDAFLQVMEERYQEAGFHLGGYSVHGFRQITSNKEIKSPEDLAGLTFRVQQNDYHILGWKSLGATPTPFAFNELYTALQQGTVDAQENPIELIYSQKFYEQQKYITLTNHQQQCQQWLVNSDVYANLSEELKTVLDKGIAAACDAATDYALSMEDSWKKEIEDYGCIIQELSIEQLKAFQDRIQPQWDKIQTAVAEEVYNAYME